MYFWDLKRLKADLLAPGLTERQSLFYMLVVFNLHAGIYLTYTMIPVYDHWFHLNWASNLGLGVLGAIYVYFRNGGNAGRKFLPRYFSLFLVCWIRWSVLVAIPVSLAIVVAVPSWPAEALGPIDLAVTAIYVPFFWWVGVHMRAVANATRAATDPSPANGPPLLEPLED